MDLVSSLAVEASFAELDHRGCFSQDGADNFCPQVLVVCETSLMTGATSDQPPPDQQPQEPQSVPQAPPSQPGHAQPQYPQAPQPGYQQPGYEQPHFGQAPQPGYYAQPGYTHPGYPQSYYNQAPQPGYYAQPSAQPGSPQPGYPQPGYPQPGYPQSGYYAQTARAPLDPTTEIQFSVLTHVLGIFFCWISSLVMFLTYGKRGPFIREHTRNNLNFQLTIALTIVVLSVFGMIALIITVATGNVGIATHYTNAHVYEWFSDSSRHQGDYSAIGLGYLVFCLAILAVYVYQIVVGIRATMATNRGQYYRFPLTINFIKP